MYEDLKKYIRSVKDFPKQGIMFRDITTLLKDPSGIKFTLDSLLLQTKNIHIDKVAGIESRGFIFGALLAEKLNIGFIPIRKPGKLLAEKIRAEYSLEYGVDVLEIHKDAILPGEKVLVHDDLLATGGTAAAACKLIEMLGGEVVQISFIIELSFLSGRDKLKKYLVNSLIKYSDEN